MRRYDLYSKRDPAKNFSPLPNEVFYLGLSYGAIAVYGYLMHIEDRKTFQSYAGYNTIGRAVKMSANTVRKYVLELEDKHLIRTEPTTVITRDGRKRNGTLRYYIRPIQEAVDHYHERQLSRLELDTERKRAQARLSRLCAAQEPLPAAGRPTTPPTVERGVSGLCGPVCGTGDLSNFQNDPVNRGAKKVQPAKDLSRIKIQKELNRPERKEGTGNQAHHSGPDELYGKWTAKRQAKLVRRVCCLS